MFVGQSVATNLRELETCIAAAFKDENCPFQQVVLQASPKLRFEKLMQIVDVCERQRLSNGKKLKKLSFVELPEEEERKGR